MQSDSAPDGDFATLNAIYPPGRGRLVVRAEGGSNDWTQRILPASIDGESHVFRVPIAEGAMAQAKVVRERDGEAQDAWMTGRNVVLTRGEQATIRPAFDHERGTLGQRVRVGPASHALDVRVFLPPSYAEQTSQRYPVLYVQDGQSVWSDGTDPFGQWSLDVVLDGLWELGVIDELLVVSIDTGEKRLDKLGPVPDKRHHGGHGARHLETLVEHIMPYVDRTYRTRTGRAHTVLLGSSMGALFSFYAAWTRPDLFGMAICLSPAFWWADRAMIREAQKGVCPAPRPRLYIDSGVAASPLEEDASTRDGVQDARAMARALVDHCYTRNDDLFVLAFAGHTHDPASWSARVAVPLQLAFPRIR